MEQKESKGHVAVIDDEAAVLRTYSNTIERDGYRVTKYQNSQSSIEDISKRLTQDTQPDISIILCDIQLGHEDGTETINQILDKYRTSKYAQFTPEILFMTGRCSEEQKQRALELSGYPIVDKLKLDREKLLEQIDAANQKYYSRIAA